MKRDTSRRSRRRGAVGAAAPRWRGLAGLVFSASTLVGCGDHRSDELTTNGALGRSSPDEDVPPSLLAALGRDRTYVEESCSSATYPDWPYAAQRCTYHGNLVVTIANPSQLQVARWILDASTLIPALHQLRERD